MRWRAKFFCLLFGGVCLAPGAVAQKPVAPPPKPADAGPSLDETMKFIQNKILAQAEAGWVITRANLAGFSMRNHARVSEMIANPVGCSFERTLIVDGVEVRPEGLQDEKGNVIDGGTFPFSETFKGSLPLKAIVSIRVDSLEDDDNRRNAKAGHPDVVLEVNPKVFHLVIETEATPFAWTVIYMAGEKAPVTKDGQSRELDFYFADEEQANRVAKALNHAVELCGGGEKAPF